MIENIPEDTFVGFSYGKIVQIPRHMPPIVVDSHFSSATFLDGENYYNPQVFPAATNIVQPKRGNRKKSFEEHKYEEEKIKRRGRNKKYSYDPAILRPLSPALDESVIEKRK
jgi:hypothetical protein